MPMVPTLHLADDFVMSQEEYVILINAVKVESFWLLIIKIEDPDFEWLMIKFTCRWFKSEGEGVSKSEDQPDILVFRYWYNGWVHLPFTAIFSNILKSTPRINRGFQWGFCDMSVNNQTPGGWADAAICFAPSSGSLLYLLKLHL